MNANFIVISIVLILIGFAQTKYYEISLEKFYLSPDTKPGWMELNTLRLSRRKKGSYVITGTVLVLRNFGKAVMVSWEVYQKVGVEEKFSRKLMSSGMKRTFCDALQSDKNIYPQLLDYSNLPPQHECPFPKGNYTIDNFELKENSLPEILAPGDYKIQTSYYNLEEYIGTMVFIVNIR